MKTVRLAFILSLIALLTTACFRFEVAFTVNEDGSGIVSYQIAVKEDLMGLAGEELDLSEEVGDLPPGAEFQEYSEDGYTGVVVTVPIDDFSDMEKVQSALGGVSETTDIEAGLADDLSISKDEDGVWQFSMVMPSTDDGLGFEGMEEGMEGLATLLLEDAWFRVRIKLPGAISDHNADRIENGELVWDLDLLASEDRQLMARSVPGGGVPIVPIVVMVAGVAVLAAFVSLAYVRRRR